MLLCRIVGQEIHGAGPQCGEDRRRVFPGALIWGKPERGVRVNGVIPFVLEVVGTDFVEQPNSAAFVTSKVHNDPRVGSNMHQGAVKLFPTVTALGGKHVPGEAFGVDTHVRDDAHVRCPR